MKTFKFEELNDAPLIIDAIYEGGPNKDLSAEPLSKLLPKTANQSGFRITKRKDDTTKPAYVAIYSTMNEIEWPDFLDVESGIFRYYGDNRKPGNDLHETSRKGNTLLKDVFTWLNLGTVFIKNIPPFLIFKKAGKGRDVKFLGLAVPGNNNIPPDRDLISIWRTKDNERFLNYEAYFTILDTQNEVISKQWLKSLINDHENNLELAPKCWKDFIDKGRLGIKALKAPKITEFRTKAEQIPNDNYAKELLQKITNYYKIDPYAFEQCAVEIIKMMDANFVKFDLTRPWRDGGRDAVGKYRIGLENNYLNVECALEAKCYALNNSVGVREMSRLISRIKYRQFGILVTTSYIHSQAYKEVLEDGHPILMISAIDIYHILLKNGISSCNIEQWLNNLK